MLKKTITYTDYNGIERTKDFYFNISKAEVLELEMTTPGGYLNLLENIINTKDTQSLYKWITELIKKAYGVKDNDGDKFVKNQAVLDDFLQSEAYSEFMVELVSDDKAASDFVNAIFPTDNTLKSV